MIYHFYQFTGIENTKDYSLDDLVDQYTFYFAVEVAVTLLALLLQVQHFKSPYLKKNQLILVATLAAVFQFGTFIILAIKTVQAHLDLALGDCYFPDCNEAGFFRWLLTGYSALTLLVLIAYGPYLKVISTLVEHDEKRDTLITEDNFQS